MFRRVLVLALAASLLSAGIFTMRSRLSGEVRVNPNARLDPEQVYSVRAWVSKPLIPTMGDYVQEVEGLVAEFTAANRNISVEISFIPENVLADKVVSAQNAGEPPDLLLNTNSSLVSYGALQVPLGLYLTKEEEALWVPSAIGQSSLGREIAGFPVAFSSRVYMVNPAIFSVDGTRLEEVVQQGWTYEQFLSAVSRSSVRGTPGIAITNSGSPMLQTLAVSLGKPSPVGDLGQLLWGKEDLLQMAGLWRKLADTVGSENVGVPNEDSLGQFLKGRVAIIGPLNPQLTRWLLTEAQGRQLKPVLLPIPAVKAPVSDLAAINLMLFRQEPYQGHSHTKASALLAKHLAQGLGSILSRHLAVIPYYRGANVEPLPFSTGYGAYANVSLAPSVPYTSRFEMSKTQEIWGLALGPLWSDFVAGKLTPEQFAEAAYTSLSNLALKPH